jgi:hypothetical protein
MVQARAKRALYPGVIHDGAAYALDDFRQRTRMGQKAIREAIKRGLRVTEVGNRRFVLGKDFLLFLSGVEQAGSSSGP